jgi:hypothetical protein
MRAPEIYSNDIPIVDNLVADRELAKRILGC